VWCGNERRGGEKHHTAAEDFSRGDFESKSHDGHDWNPPSNFGTRFQDKKCGDDCQYLARVYPPSIAKEMIATAAATAARAVGTRTAPAVVGAVRSFWADVPMAPKVRAVRSSRSFFVGGHRRSVLLARPVATTSRPIADVSIPR